MRNFVALFVIGIEIFKFNIITELCKFSNRIILYLEGCLISATPSGISRIFWAHFLHKGAKLLKLFVCTQHYITIFFIQNLNFSVKILRNFVALFVIGIEIFKFNIITELLKFSNRIILYSEGCLISATPSVNLAHFLSALPS